MTATIRATHQGGDRLLITVRGHEIRSDQPVADGGDDSAPTPTEIFLAGLAGCVAFYAGRFLRRNQLTTEGLAVVCRYAWTENPHRVGVIMGAGMGGMLIGEEEFAKVYLSNRPHRVHPNFIPMITLNSASGIIAMTFRAKGPNLTISTACSSSAHAIGLSLAAIRAGQADVVITGGAEASLTPLAFAGFCALRALSTAYNDQPTRASRPFERARDGFVMGEGARP
jgi:3-oxoacyl-(acyl-carrier-protein) synthase